MKWILVLVTLALFSSLLAEPRQWEPAGLAVRPVSIIEDYSQASREDGTTLIVWAQSLGAFPVVMGQLLAPDGEALWTEGGITLAQAERRAGAPVAVAVGEEWVIAWQDAELISSGRAETGWYGESSLRLIRIDDNGAPVWANGQAGLELVPTGEWWDIKPYTLHESGDGVIVTWRQTVDHWAQRIGANGERMWPEDVRLKARLNSRLPDIASDRVGGLVFCWWQILAGDTMIFANRLLQDGTFAWNDTSGVIVHTSNQMYEDVTICADAQGGAYVAWMQDNDDVSDPYAQYVNSQGEVMWPASGVLLADLTGYRKIKAIAPSFLGETNDGVLAVMYEQDPQWAERLVAQKLSPAGVSPWGADGITFCSTDPNSQYFGKATLISDQSGGALCYHDREISTAPNSTDLLANRITADGSLPWGHECGVLIESELTPYFVIISTPNVTEDAVQVVWLDMSYNDTRTMQAQRLDLATGALEFATPTMLATSDPNGVQEIQAVKLANGSTAVAWQAWAEGLPTLLYQILDVFGQPMFGEHGAPLRTDGGVPLSAEDCALCPDGSGGFFAAFKSFEAGFYIARAVHINGQGQNLSDPAGEVIFDNEDWPESHELFCIPDGNGGSYIASTIFNENFTLINAVMRVDAQCQPMWNDPVVHEDPLRDVETVTLVPSENGSCIVVYTPLEFGLVNVKAARINSNGVEAWNVAVETAAYGAYYDNTAACSDAANGVYVVWGTVSDNGEEFRTKLQNLSPAGVKLWGEAGLTLADTAYQARYYSCDVDQVGNLTFAWQLYDGQDGDIFAQRVSRAGVFLWPVGGLLLTNAALDQYSPKVITLSDNEVYVLWSDARNSSADYWDNDIYGTHLNAQGEIGDDSYWQENGSPICDEDFDQRSHVAIADGAGGVMVAWLDQRTAFNWVSSVFAQRLYDPIFTDADEPTVLPTEFAFQQNYPNPFNPETVIEFALPTTSKATMKVFDVTGREVATLLDQPLSAGVHRVNFNAQKLASGVYFYTLKADQHSLTKKMVLLK